MSLSDESGNKAVLLFAFDIVQKVLANLAEVIVDAVIVADHQGVVSFYRIPAVFVRARIRPHRRTHVIHVRVRELVVNFSYYEVLR